MIERTQHMFKVIACVPKLPLSERLLHLMHSWNKIELVRFLSLYGIQDHTYSYAPLRHAIN